MKTGSFGKKNLGPNSDGMSGVLSETTGSISDWKTDTGHNNGIDDMIVRMYHEQGLQTHVCHVIG